MRVANFAVVFIGDLKTFLYHRFRCRSVQCSWGFWGYNSRYAEKRATDVLTHIYKNWSRKGTKSIRNLSEEEWKEAVYETYPL